jgi:hypothetical protein
MKLVSELDLGYNNAENYRRREEHEFFRSVFWQTPELDKLCQSNIYFLIGEKGTGKTAYAVYMANSEYKNNVAKIKYIRETEYLKFVSLKQEKQLTMSDYMSVWKVIIYLMLAQQIRDKEGASVFKSIKFRKLGEVIDEFYKHAFSPEIVNAIQFAENASISANLISQVAEFGGTESSSVTFSESNFQINLFYIQKHFEDALRSLKLDKNEIIFIDGIDIRPATIEYEIYIECIKGLANAVWSMNNDFFANIKDSKGRIRVVLLIRPDIFDKLGLQNMNSKVRDNSVVLNWVTTYEGHRSSPLFLMADRLLSFQQEINYPPGTVWNYYFPYDATNVKIRLPSPTSFIQFLRYCLYRPRNIMTILAIQKENLKEQGKSDSSVFSYSDFTNPRFSRKYSDYILGEVKDHISFYFDAADYESMLKFFQYLNGRSIFTYPQYMEAFTKFIKFLQRNNYHIPPFCDTPDLFLQFLYDLNILGYIVETRNKNHSFFSWCNRERSPSNIAPKVRTHVTYEVHYGLMKALDLGVLFNINDEVDWDNSVVG